MEPSLIHSPRSQKEVGNTHPVLLSTQRSPGTSDAEAQVAPLRVTGGMAMEKRR